MLGGRICRWLILFQEYGFEVIVKPKRLNSRVDHFSRIENGEEPTNIDERLHDAHLFVVRVVDEHFADIILFISIGVAPKGYTRQHVGLLGPDLGSELISQTNPSTTSPFGNSPQSAD